MPLGHEFHLILTCYHIQAEYFRKIYFMFPIVMARSQITVTSVLECTKVPPNTLDLIGIGFFGISTRIITLYSHLYSLLGYHLFNSQEIRGMTIYFHESHCYMIILYVTGSRAISIFFQIRWPIPRSDATNNNPLTMTRRLSLSTVATDNKLAHLVVRSTNSEGNVFFSTSKMSSLSGLVF